MISFVSCETPPLDLPHSSRCVLDVAPLRLLPAFFQVLEALPAMPPDRSPMQVCHAECQGEGKWQAMVLTFQQNSTETSRA